jgi:hypothetical protein
MLQAWHHEEITGLVVSMMIGIANTYPFLSIFHKLNIFLNFNKAHYEYQRVHFKY